MSGPGSPLPQLQPRPMQPERFARPKPVIDQDTLELFRAHPQRCDHWIRYRAEQEAERDLALVRSLLGQTLTQMRKVFDEVDERGSHADLLRAWGLIELYFLAFDVIADMILSPSRQDEGKDQRHDQASPSTA